MEYYLDAFRNYANFKGRATRKEFWMFTLFNVIIALAIAIVSNLLLGKSTMNIIVNIYGLAVTIPNLAITIRRLHDIGRSGWWYLLNFTLIGGIVVFIFLCMPSQEGSNQWDE